MGDRDEAMSRPDPIGDLDGDGIPEVAFYFGTPMMLVMHVYRCERHIATIEGTGGLKPGKASHEGFVDLELADYAACDGAMCGCVPGHATFVFHDGAYHEDKSTRQLSERKTCPGETAK